MNKRHILVINDTPAILDLFGSLLGEEGYHVTVNRFSESPEALLAFVKARQPDLIILDLVIGHEELGWQFLQMLKMDRETRAIPEIVCTAAVKHVRDLELHLDAMGVAVVLKPFDIDNLLRVIAGVWDDPAP